MSVKGGGAERVAQTSLSYDEAVAALVADPVLTNSMRRSFCTCRRAAYYQYLQRLSPRSVHIPFLLGDLFHDELARTYTGTSAGDEERPAAFAFDKEACALRATAAVEKALVKSLGLTEEQVDKIWMQQGVACGMAAGHAKRYLAADKAAWEVLEVECKNVKLPIEGSRWSLSGKLDLLVRFKKTRKPALVEHKSTSDISAGYVARLPLDWQILGYVKAAAKKLGEPVKEVVYNLVKKPAIRQRKGETMEAFISRLEDVYLLEPAAYFHRERVQVTAKMVDKFSAKLAAFVKALDQCIAGGPDSWYENVYACDLRGACPFMRLCVDGENADTLLHYERRQAVHAELAEEEEAS